MNREVDSNGQIVTPVKRMEDSLETHRSLLQLSPMKDEVSCSSFQTEIKYEGTFKYIKQSDGQNVSFLCCECEFQARVEDVLRSHVRLHSTQFGESDCFYSCNLCHYNINSAVQLEFHIKTCHKQKLNKKEIDVRKWEETDEVSDDDTDTDYSDVEIISDNEAFIDGDIGRGAVNIEDISVSDKMYVKPATNGKNVEYSGCGVSFGHVSNFKKPIELQTREKKYLCSFCHMTFSRSSCRSRHEKKIHKINLGLMEFKCNMCPEQYSTRKRLENHMKIKHSI